MYFSRVSDNQDLISLLIRLYRSFLCKDAAVYGSSRLVHAEKILNSTHVNFLELRVTTVNR